MPPLPPEMKMLLDNLSAQILQTQTRAEGLQSYVQAELEKLRQEKVELTRLQSAQQEQIKAMAEDIQDLKKQLADTQDIILKNQQANFRRIIYVQGSILFLILSTVIGVIVKLLFP